MANVIGKKMFLGIAKTVAASAALSIAISLNAVKVEAASLIQESLFFGRDIPEGGEVSDADFQTFLNNVITPRFPDGLTVFDANGQYLDNSGTLIKEKSKNISLLFDDTLQNKTSISDIINKYTQQFNQESVLQVLDDNVNVSFITAPEPISVPEPAFAWGLVALGVLGAGSALKKKIAGSTHRHKYVTITEWVLTAEAQICVDEPIVGEHVTQGKRIGSIPLFYMSLRGTKQSQNSSGQNESMRLLRRSSSLRDAARTQ
ncbi:DUF3574 domain-containing protein [Nostoc sp. CHAB 5715]|uniref:DUF3574 domain-containing protein n=1 Tax=Nostoc sp. CHAB 5715 TaxID=2780400 RepID=UPI001E64B4B0|nr:DUF3574 domain-containing protein [Nostoc sp. CHAB 5715]MCC5621943.1 DUF3574 domain-containing protein [Nostoc sp. CHAB 5715]